MNKTLLTKDILSTVQEHYGRIAEQRNPASCCSPSASLKGGCCTPSTSVEKERFSQISQVYQDAEVLNLPKEITDLSLGCGDPITLASLKPGQVVVDLGSGGGIDCFLAAKKVGSSGMVIGVDMTPAMLVRARENKEKGDYPNVEFRLGEIEHLPVADNVADVIISNCVINLSPDKPQVFREAFRILRSGGRIAFSDIINSGKLPEPIQQSMEAWAGCVAGALSVDEYSALLRAAGFVDVNVDAHYFPKEMVDDVVQQATGLGENIPAELDIYHAVFHGKISAQKP